MAKHIGPVKIQFSQEKKSKFAKFFLSIFPLKKTQNSIPKHQLSNRAIDVADDNLVRPFVQVYMARTPASALEFRCHTKLHLVRAWTQFEHLELFVGQTQCAFETRHLRSAQKCVCEIIESFPELTKFYFSVKKLRILTRTRSVQKT
jgi:hypothetical protein